MFDPNYLQVLGAHPLSIAQPVTDLSANFRRNRDGQVAALAAQALAVSGVTGQRYEEARANDWFVVRRGSGGRGG